MSYQDKIYGRVPDFWQSRLSVSKIKKCKSRQATRKSPTPETPGTIGDFTIKEWYEIISDIIANPHKPKFIKSLPSGNFIIRINHVQTGIAEEED